MSPRSWRRFTCLESTEQSNNATTKRRPRLVLPDVGGRPSNTQPGPAGTRWFVRFQLHAYLVCLIWSVRLPQQCLLEDMQTPRLRQRTLRKWCWSLRAGQNAPFYLASQLLPGLILITMTWTSKYKKINWFQQYLPRAHLDQSLALYLHRSFLNLGSIAVGQIFPTWL